VCSARQFGVLTHALRVVDLSSGGNRCCCGCKAKRSDVWERRARRDGIARAGLTRQSGVNRHYIAPGRQTALWHCYTTLTATFPMRKSPPHSPPLVATPRVPRPNAFIPCPSQKSRPDRHTQPYIYPHSSSIPLPSSSIPRSPIKVHRPPRPSSSFPSPALSPERLHGYQLFASLEPRSKVLAVWRASRSIPRWSAG
jgi:hypothetical protein